MQCSMGCPLTGARSCRALLPPGVPVCRSGSSSLYPTSWSWASAAPTSASLAGNMSNFRLPVSAWLSKRRWFRKALMRGNHFDGCHRCHPDDDHRVGFDGCDRRDRHRGRAPGSVVAAFDWLLPSIWAAIVVQFGLRNWRYAVVAIIASLVVVIYSGLPGWSHISPCAPADGHGGAVYSPPRYMDVQRSIVRDRDRDDGRRAGWLSPAAQSPRPSPTTWRDRRRAAG